MMDSCLEINGRCTASGIPKHCATNRKIYLLLLGAEVDEEDGEVTTVVAGS
jgi:hypothetical protein